MRLAEIQDAKNRQKSPSRHHRTTLSGCIFATKACIDNREKLLNSNTSSTCPDNMVNFGLLTAEIGSGVWGTPTNFNEFASWQRYCTASSSGRQPNIAALNRGCHLCSAGRPSGWALAHISSIFMMWFVLSIFFSSPNLSRRRLDVYHTSAHGVVLVMVALCNRETIYIFMLWFVLLLLLSSFFFLA